MATLVATKRNSVIAKFYQRLLQHGKPKKLALIACMRKLLLIIHDMVRNGQMWDPSQKRSVTKLLPAWAQALRARWVIDSPATKLSLTKLRPRRALLCFT